MAKPKKKKSLLEKKKELERVANEVEQHFQKVSVWQPRKEDREKKEKEWPGWCQRFDELILRLVEIIQSSPEFCEEVKDDKRYELLRDYYQGLCLRRNGEPATSAQTSSGWVNRGCREQPVEYNEADHLMGFIRAVVRRILEGPDETQLSPAWQEYLDQIEEQKERKRQLEDAVIMIGRGASHLQRQKSDSGEQPPAAEAKRGTPSDHKEVPWNPNDQDYISAKDAVERAEKVLPGFTYKYLNKVLKPDGQMRYMRNPDAKDRGPGSIQRKVHEGELDIWLDGLKRTATANKRQRKDNISKLTDTGDGPYQNGFTEGRVDGYAKGYGEVKHNKQYSCQPPYEDDPADQYAHGYYEGWKRGYIEGRLDSEEGKPEKYGR